MNVIRQHIQYTPPVCPPCVWHKRIARFPHPGPLTLSRIIKHVANDANCFPDDMRGPRRHSHICRIRWAAIWLCRELTGASYPQIGKALCRDHTTIMHGYQMALNIRERHPFQRREMDRLRRELSGEFMG